MTNAAWSYSRIKSFEQCPKKFYHLKVAKDYEEPETSAMGYGTAFHLAAEEFIRDGKPVPDEFSYATAALATFKHFPDVKRIRAGLLFVISKDLVKATYRIDEQAVLWDKWMADYARMEKAFEVDVWNPRPSGLCKRHCVVTECIHNGNN